jgi:hypothetical protein
VTDAEQRLYEGPFTTDLLRYVGWALEAQATVTRHLRTMRGVETRKRDGRRGPGR